MKKIAILFVVSIVLTLVVSLCSLYSNNKRPFFDYYDFNLFYVQIQRLVNKEIVLENNPHLFIQGTFYSEDKSESIDKNFIRLYNSKEDTTSFYYIICPKKYNMATLKLFDSDDISWINETYPIKIHPFGTYTLFLGSGNKYIYSNCGWFGPHINAYQFVDYFLAQYNVLNTEDPLHGVISYPNLLNSFYNIVSNTNELAGIRRVDNDLTGENAYEQFKSLENNFLEFVK